MVEDKNPPPAEGPGLALGPDLLPDCQGSPGPSTPTMIWARDFIEILFTAKAVAKPAQLCQLP